MLNADTIEGKWMELRGKVKEWWGEIAGSDRDRIQGKCEQLVGLLQQQYGLARAHPDNGFAQFLTWITSKR